MLRTKDFRVFAEKIVLPEPTDCEFLINQYADKLLEKIFIPNILYRASGVYAEKLVETTTSQMFLFQDKRTQKAQKLSSVIDNLESKYGKNCLQIGLTKDPQEENKNKPQTFFS